jgi:hypothetical protein
MAQPTGGCNKPVAECPNIQSQYDMRPKKKGLQHRKLAA